MFIVWGTKVSKKRLGQVADYCPLCRDLTCFEVTEVRKVGHLYYIPLGSGEAAGWYRTCRACDLILDAHPSEYDTFANDRGIDVVDLAEMTNPDVHSKYAERIELEKRMALGSLTPEERAALLVEPFLLLEPRVQERCRDVNIDMRTGFLGMTATAITISLFVAAANTSGAAGGAMFNAAWIVAACGAVVVLISMFTDSRRFVRRRIMPSLTDALRPVQPSLEELNDVIAQLRASKAKIGRKVRAEDLYSSLVQVDPQTASIDVVS